MEKSSQTLGNYALYQYHGSEDFSALLDSIPLAVFHPQQTTRYLKFIFFTYLALADSGLSERVRSIAWGRILLYGWRNEVPKDHFKLAIYEIELILSESGVPASFSDPYNLEATPNQVTDFIDTYFHQDHHARIRELLFFLSSLSTYP